MERPLCVQHRLFCNFAADLPEKNSSCPVPDKELAPSNSPHRAVRWGQSGIPQFPTLTLLFVKNPFY